MKKHLLKKLNLEPTRENYLAIDRWEPDPELTAEEEAMLPPQFRHRSSRPPKEAPVKKPEVMPEVPPKDQKPEVPVTYTRRVLTPEQQAAHDWKLENWLRCRGECDFGNPPYLSPELGHNSGACAPSRMITLLSWIPTSIKRRVSTRPAPASGARCAAGRRAKKTNGSAPADTNGTRSTREECVPLACTSGLRPSASRAAAGRRIRIGITIHDFRNRGTSRSCTSRIGKCEKNSRRS